MSIRSSKDSVARGVLMSVAGLALTFFVGAEASAQFNNVPSMRGPSAASMPQRATIPSNMGIYVPPRPDGGGVRPPRPDRPGMRPPSYRPPGPGIFIPPIVLPDPDDAPQFVPPARRPPSPPKNASRQPRRSGSGVPPNSERRHVPDEVLIEVASNFTNQAADALARRHRLTRLESISLGLSGTTMFRWRIPDRRSVPQVIRALETESAVVFAQPMYLHRLQQDQAQQADALAGGDPGQYALSKLRLPQAHGLARGDKVLVAVIDSRVDPAHPELAGTIADAFDPTGTNPKPHSHGTAIAGTIVAHARLLGVAPGARILAVSAFGGAGASADSTTFAILKGLDWSASRGARIINMSFAGPQDPAMGRSLAAARERGIILVAAAGNAGPKSPPLYPAADRNVIAVTATDADDKLFQGANRGRHIAVAAPGVDVLLPAPEGTYQVTTGTSFSAAFVSGTAALLLERRPDLSPDAMRRALTQTAADLGPKGNDNLFGAGLVDAYRAILSVDGGEAGAAKVIPAAVR